MFCLGIEEIDESQIHEIGEFNPQIVPEEFGDLDEFKEPKLKKRKKGIKCETKPLDLAEDVEMRESLQVGDGWNGFPTIDSKLLLKLESNSYLKPTEIQAKTLSTSLAGKDVIAAAETGSGKTLAYGIPVVNELMKKERENIGALILVPTRELAKQVVEHLKRVSDLRVVGVYGGLSVQKQKRLIKTVDILVATPGRLGALLELDDIDLSSIKFLVIDEADKMLEPHHFKQMDMILDKANKDRQTLVFSATILPENTLQQIQSNKGKTVNLFTQLLKRVEFRGEIL